MKYRKRGMPLDEALVSRRIIPVGPGCWLWSGQIDTSGYPTISIKSRHHRVKGLAYELWVGPIPEGKWILHKCNNRACWNPEHVYPGTAADNARDRNDSDRTCQGKSHPFSRLTPLAVEEIRSGKESIARLAKKFSVARSVIWKARKGISYKT